VKCAGRFLPHAQAIVAALRQASRGNVKRAQNRGNRQQSRAVSESGLAVLPAEFSGQYLLVLRIDGQTS